MLIWKTALSLTWKAGLVSPARAPARSPPEKPESSVRNAAWLHDWIAMSVRCVEKR